MKTSKYTAKKPDDHGWIDYSDEENAVWETLYSRQMKILPNRACNEYLRGIDLLEIAQDKIPQIPAMNKRLNALTGWEVVGVPALIDFATFFDLLADKKFPCATFIRNRDELDYLQEPDIFHEIFGHCPLITVPAYANFMEQYGKLGKNVSHKDKVMLARLYWFTIEFGLLNTKQGLRIYGGGILSSFGETQYCLEDDKPLRKPLEVIDALRTPYRIDIFQSIYFVINKFDDLFDIMETDLIAAISKARELGMHKPLFPPKQADDNNDPRIC